MTQWMGTHIFVMGRRTEWVKKYLEFFRWYVVLSFDFVYKLGGLGESLLWALHLIPAGGKPFGFWLVLAVFLPPTWNSLAQGSGLANAASSHETHSWAQSSFSLVFLEWVRPIWNFWRSFCYLRLAPSAEEGVFLWYYHNKYSTDPSSAPLIPL